MISIIVPVFRVEKYLDRCIQSLINQSYKDIEIILVDDGSDDNCPTICDNYKKKDSRIKVIHKENGGLSDARNVGVENAKGDYIAFVDSDDYVHPKMYEYMLRVLEHNKEVDIAVCPYEKIGEDQEDAQLDSNAKNEYYIMEHDQIIEEMFSKKYGTYIVAWNKLYKRQIWGDFTYPKGKIHEDEFTTYKPLFKAKRVACFFEPMYYYRQHEGSIMSVFKEQACRDNMEALKEKMHFFENASKRDYALCAKKTLETMICYYRRAKEHKEESMGEDIRKDFLEIWGAVKKKGTDGIEKERIAYFNSFSVSYEWMNFYMRLYWRVTSVRRKIFNYISKRYGRIKGRIEAGSKMNPQIMSIEDTITEIIKNKCSVSRFGDGEYKWMAGIPQTSFQRSSKEMCKRLREICISEEKNHLVCLSDGFGKLTYLNKDARRFWYDFMGQYRKDWISYLKPGKIYYNTNMTRPYMDYSDKSLCENRFRLLKEIWKERDIILIEGEKSRLGMGNDLFSTARSIRRILAPAVDAYGKYQEIYEEACKQQKDALYLVALGPTATILAYDLHKTGRQAIDVGHVDIEYEWYLMGATKKVAVKDKYVNEVNAGEGVEEAKDAEYQAQIIAKIERW